MNRMVSCACHARARIVDTVLLGNKKKEAFSLSLFGAGKTFLVQGKIGTAAPKRLLCLQQSQRSLNIAFRLDLR